MPTAKRKRSSSPVFDEARFREALADLKRLVGDDSDTTWADSLPEAPPLPDGPDETVAVFVSGKAEHARPKPVAGRRTEQPAKRMTVEEAAAKFFNDAPPSPEHYQQWLDLLAKDGTPIPKALRLRKGNKR